MHLGQSTDGYRLILANNRDELWDRPTDTAAIRGTARRWIGGIDVEPGKEGGTWLGVSENGQLAILLNILEVQKPDAKGRGFFVPNFLTGEKTVDEYLADVATEHDLYNPFHLILVDLRYRQFTNQHKPTLCVKTITCSHNTEPITHSYSDGYVSCDNSRDITKPWKKRSVGEKQFSDIVAAYGSPEHKADLVERLMGLMNDRVRHLPDLVLAEQFAAVGRSTESEFFKQRAAVSVFSPEVKYGTRTNTIILVDHTGNCSYIERTLKMPVSVDKPDYSVVELSFKIKV
ncbi:hypothetical protein DPMN_015767 [Dreissena polymorpha]|uniref:Transport and Golgi organization protein 2 n=2 Tax=Dreissena polymorpha TaxID=45954 RepID=A0A9D4S6G8_DREPO|nr:hypothetical protein DPMN_015767 [Dreissena polymorpha]